MKHTQGKIKNTPKAGNSGDLRIRDEANRIIADCYSFSEAIPDDEAVANAERIVTL